LLHADHQIEKSSDSGGDIKSFANRKELSMKTPAPAVRRALHGVFATCLGGGAVVAVIAVPSATAVNDPCAASEIARTIGSVATSKDVQSLEQPLQNLSGRCKLPLTLPQVLLFLQAAQNGQSPNTPGVGLSLPQNSTAPTAPGPLPGPALAAPASPGGSVAAAPVSTGGTPSAR
jgi:heme-binding protein